MYIRVTKSNTSKKETVYLVEGYRDKDGKVKQRIVKRYGYLDDLQKDDPDILDKLKAEAKLMHNDIVIPLMVNTLTTNEFASVPLNYGYFFLDSIYESLKLPMFISNNTRKYNIKYNPNQIMKLLVYSRILKPDSKKATFEDKDRFFNMDFNFSLDDLYRSLSIMNNFKEDLEIWLHNQVTELIGRDTTLVFYDVTNYYFEIEYDDEDETNEDGEIIEEGLRRKGVSKEHRPTPIIQMGMFIDKNGIPIAYKLFSGNTNDKVTLLPVLEEMKAKYNIGRVIVVADKGLNSGSNLLFIKNNNDGYVVAQQIRKRKKEMISKVLDQNGYVYNQTNDFKIKSWLEDKEVKDKDGKTHILKEKVLCFWSKDFEDREKHKRGDIEELIKKFIDKPSLYTASNSWGVKKYLKEKNLDKVSGEVKKKNPVLIFDEEKYKRDSQLDGYYMLVTSEIELSNEEIIEHYRGLWRIEESFRILKGDLEGRPVFVHTKDHIEAHFLICFISLVVMRILQYKLGYKYSAESIQKVLNEATVSLISQEIYLVHKQTETFKEIEKVFKVKLDRAYSKSKTLKEYKKALHNISNQ
ncbi:MAG: IS1634 family transposase [Bacilli bacterium]|jgi:transposase